MPVINGVYTKDFPALGRAPIDTDIIPIAEVANQITYKTTIGAIFNAKVFGTTGRLSKFTGANTLGNSILNEIGNAIHLTNGGLSYASFGIINPGTPGDPGIDNDAYIGSTINNDFTIRVNNTEAARFDTALRFKIANIPNADTDTDKFLVSDGGLVKYRTGTELRSDIGAGVGSVTSVGLTMPVAFSVANSPITSAGTLEVTAIGSASQYIRGDGTLATIPSTSSGGANVNYYLNGSVAASVATYKQMDYSAVIGGGTDFNLTGNGLIAQFLTDAGNPNRLLIPGGAWNFEMYFNISSSGGNSKFYVELLKYDGTTFTSIASSVTVPEEITGGTTTDLYITSLAVPETVLLITDRLALRVYIVDNSGGRTVTLHTEDNTLCLVTTTFAGGIAALNGLTANTQYFAVGTTGSDFNISSVLDTHTFNLPSASATARGLITTGSQTIAGEKTFSDFLTLSGSISVFGNADLKGLVALGTNKKLFWNTSSSAYINSTATNVMSLGVNNADVLSLSTAGLLVTGQLSLTSTITNGTYTYTLPSATGTLALTSQLHDAVTLSAIGSTPNANGATLTGQVLNLQPASASYGGVVSTGTQTFAGQKTFIDAVILNSTLNLTSGALSIIYNPANTAYWQTYVDSSNVFNFGFNGTNVKASISSGGNITGASFIKSGGTSSQFLKADGSVDSTAYGTGSVTSVAALTLGTSGTDLNSSVENGTTTPVITLNVPDASASNRGVITTGAQTIAGAKTFTSSRTIFQNNDFAQITFKNTSDLTKTLEIGYASNGNIFSSNGLDFRVGGLTSSALLISANENATFKENLTAKSFIKTSGTSSQFLMADGSVNTSVSPSGAYLPLSGGTLTGALNGTSATFSGNGAFNTTSAVSGYALDVRAATNKRVGVANSNSLSGAPVVFYNDSNGYADGYIDATKLILQSQSGGNVLIGSTTDSGQKLQVTGSAKITGIITLGTAGGSFVYDSAGSLILQTGASARLTIDTSGNSTFSGTLIAQSNIDLTGDLRYKSNVGYGLKSENGTRLFEVYNTGISFVTPLNGTSATFSGNVTVQSDAAYYRIRRASGTDVGYITDASTWGASGNDFSIGASSANLKFFTNNSVTVKATLDSSGNLGLGVTPINGYGILQINASASFSTIASLIKLSNGANAYANRQSVFEFGQGGTNPNGYSHQISASTAGSSIDNTLNFALCDGGETTRVNVMTLLGTGSVEIGYGSVQGAYKLDVNGTGRFSGNVKSRSSSISTNSAAGSFASPLFTELKFLGFNDGERAMIRSWSVDANSVEGRLSFFVNTDTNVLTERLTIASTGAATFSSSVTATAFFESSDSRLKTLITDNHQAKGIESITAKLYTKNGVEELGYFAQDVQSVLPSAVIERDDTYLDLSYRQVHTAKIANLENRIKQLEDLIKQLI
jgi:hypothetical protein